MAETDRRLLLLAPEDNVLVARDQISAGEIIRIEGVDVRLADDLRLGHKLARRAIVARERVWKYGAPIGRATRAIAIGEHVHVHNLVSDYTPTYVIDDGARGAHAK